MNDEKETERGPVEKEVKSLVEEEFRGLDYLIKNGEDSKVTGRDLIVIIADLNGHIVHLAREIDNLAKSIK